ncbi:MAG TPA: ABC transporter permease [Arachnia sp.]|jgi:simple sugar transport system permease protein|nr:ABC transporter permease [Propionibacteriaceae bacterium]HOA26025.1 ABC transporter permease [Arachnia sp.]HQD21987.1 ABC transporter permease [Arachnia sp.]
MTTTTVTPTKKKRVGLGLDPHLQRLVFMLAALLLLFAIMKTDSFTRVSTWQAMGVAFPEFGIMALGVMLTMITGGIDLSSVGIANMTAIASATVMLSIAPSGADAGQQATAVLVGVVLSIVLGTLAGVFNGFLVSKVRIPAILVTLGTLELFTGIAIVISAGKPLSGLPPAYSELLGGKILRIPMPLIIFVVLALVIGFILTKMAFGKKLYMIGSNATAAKFSGLNSVSLLVRTYALSGLCAGVAGLVMMANYNSAKADYGVAYTLLTVLIVVLGGVDPNGGSGRLIGVIMAIAILQILQSGLNTFPQVSNFYLPLIWGAVLLVVISTGNVGNGFLARFRKKG